MWEFEEFRGGRTRFDTAALTVNIGSFTTWLSLRFIATLQRRYALTPAKPNRATSTPIMREVAARATAAPLASGHSRWTQREGNVPALRDQASSSTVICSSTSALRGSAETPMAAR